MTMKKILLFLALLALYTCAKDNDELPKTTQKSNVATIQSIKLTLGSKTIDGSIQGDLISFEVDQIPSEAIVDTVITSHPKATTNRQRGSTMVIQNGKSTLTVTAEDNSTKTYSILFILRTAKIETLEITVNNKPYKPTLSGLNWSIEITNLSPDVEVVISQLTLSPGATADINLPYKYTLSSSPQTIIITSSQGSKATYTLSVKPKVLTAVKRVVIEEFSGQNCPNCPIGYSVVKKLLQEHPDHLISVNIQAGGLSRPELRISQGQQLWDYFKIPYQPRAIIDRKNNKQVYEYANWAKEVKSQIQQKAIVAINANISLNNRSLTANLSFEFTQNTTQRLKVIGYITQNNIIAYQANASSQYSHQHVLRSIATNSHLGDPLPQTSFVQGKTYTHTISTTIPNSVKLNDAQLVIILADASTDQALNAFEVKLN